MSNKALDRQGRWRSKTIAFRISPEENQNLEDLVSISGLSKQDYIINRVLDKPVVIYGNPRVFKGLKHLMNRLINTLNDSGDRKLSPEEFEILKDICEIYIRLSYNDEMHKIDS